MRGVDMSMVQKLERELELARQEVRLRAEREAREAAELAQKEAKEAAEVAAWAKSKFPPMTHLLYQI